jgi:hypothetical protein
MNAANLIAIFAAVIAALSLFVAALQYLETKRRKESERELLARREERLRTAEASAKLGAQIADLIVQRSKDENTDRDAIADFARVLRGNLAVLAKQLSDEASNDAVADKEDSLDSLRAAKLKRRARIARGHTGTNIKSPD